MPGSNTTFGSDPFGTGPLGQTPFYSTKTLIDAILKATGHAQPSQETLKRDVILTMLNNRYQLVTLGHQYRWSYQNYELNIFGYYNKGTANFTQGLDVVTGNDTVWTAFIRPGDYMFNSVFRTLYKVKEVISNTELRLTCEYSDVPPPTQSNVLTSPATGTVLSSQSYFIQRSIYKLPQSVDEIKNVSIFNLPNPVRLVGQQDFRIIQNRQPVLQGTPQVATIIHSAEEDDATYMEIYPLPDQAYTAQIDFSSRITSLYDATSSLPLIPDRYRAVLFYGGLADFYTRMGNPIQSQAAEQRFQAFFATLKNDTALTDQTAQIIQARNYKRRRRAFGMSISAADYGRLDNFYGIYYG